MTQLPSPKLPVPQLSVTRPTSPLLAGAALLTTVLLWASAFPGVRLALQTFDPITLAALRYAVAALFLMSWWLWRPASLPSRRDLLRLALSGGIGIAGYNILLNAGQVTVSAGAASFLINTVPMITLLLSALWLREPVRRWTWIGTGLGFCGVALITLDQPGERVIGHGVYLVLGAALCQAVFFLLQRPLVARYGAPACTTWVILFGALALGPWLPAGVTQAQTAGAASLVVIYLGVFPAALGYMTWAYAQSHFGPSLAANALYLVPFLASALAIPLAGEHPGTITMLGGAIAVSGVYLATRRPQASVGAPLAPSEGKH